MPSPETKIQIDGLVINPNKPLIITDADEVIVELFIHLFDYFKSRGYDFKGHSLIGFEIMEFMFCSKTGDLIEENVFVKIITLFFKDHADDLPLVKNAYKNLEKLANQCQIVILTNAPHSYRNARIQIFKNHGFEYPIITNEGNKLAAVNRIAAQHQAPVFFIDDSPEHHIAIINDMPHVDCIHFIGDERYAKMVSNVENIDFKSTCWNEVGHYIETQLKECHANALS